MQTHRITAKSNPRPRQDGGFVSDQQLYNVLASARHFMNQPFMTYETDGEKRGSVVALGTE